jgi:hypothetical protein
MPSTCAAQDFTTDDDDNTFTQVALVNGDSNRATVDFKALRCQPYRARVQSRLHVQEADGPGIITTLCATHSDPVVFNVSLAPPPADVRVLSAHPTRVDVAWTLYNSGGCVPVVCVLRLFDGKRALIRTENVTAIAAGGEHDGPYNLKVSMLLSPAEQLVEGQSVFVAVKSVSEAGSSSPASSLWFVVPKQGKLGPGVCLGPGACRCPACRCPACRCP